MIDFPNSPTVGQIFSAGGFSWRWDGVRWVGVGQVPLANPNKFHNGFLWFDQVNEGNPVTIPSGGMGTYMQDGVRLIATSSRISGGNFTGMQAAGGGSLLAKCCSLYITNNTNAVAAGDYVMLFNWLLEGNQLADALWPGSAAMPLTLSFWFRANIAGTYSIAMSSQGSQSPQRSYVVDFAAPGDSVWHFYSFTIPPDTDGGWYNTIFLSTVGFSIGINGGAGGTYRAPAATTWLSGNYLIGPGNTNPVFSGNGYYWLGPHKLEVGSIATPMLRGSPSEELARCQRYYEKSYSPGIVPGTNLGTNGNAQLVSIYCTAGGNFIATSTTYKVPKRAAPTVTTYAYNGAAGSMGALQSGTWGVVGSTALQTNNFNGHGMYVASSTCSAISWDYVADARL